MPMFEELKIHLLTLFIINVLSHLKARFENFENMQGRRKEIKVIGWDNFKNRFIALKKLT